MARKCKIGIQYFSHDVDMAQDKKIKLLKAKHGLLGYAVFLRLLEELYRDNGYYLKADEDFNILFSDDNNLSYDDYILILNECINKQLFDKDLFEEHGILTSRRIQQNYINATERRKEVEFIDEYLLVDAVELYGEKSNVIINSINADIKKENVDINNENDNKSTQSKRKVKGKEKESKSHDVDAILSFHNSLDGLPKYKKLTSARKSIVTARIKEYGIEEVKKTLIKANESNFLRNESGKWYTFDWIYNVNNFVKIYEDNYKDKEQAPKREVIDENPFLNRGERQ